MTFELRFFDSCPHHEAARHLLEDVLRQAGWQGTVALTPVETPEQAESLGFRGSPTFMLDGVDPFADPTAPVALSCRLYTTSAGLAGLPEREELVRAVAAVLGTDDR